MSNSRAVPQEASKINYKYDRAPAPSDPRIMKHGRPVVVDQCLESKYYKYIMYYYYTRVFGPFLFVPLSVIGVSMLINSTGIVHIPWYITLVLLGAAAYRSYGMIDAMLEMFLSRLVGHEFHERPSLKEDANYKSSDMIWRLWLMSPYRRTLLRCAVESGLITQQQLQQHQQQLDDVSVALPAPLGEWDRPEEATVFQPSEGFCGPATINTTVLSVYGAELLSMKKTPTPLNMGQFVDIFTPTVSNECVRMCVLNDLSFVSSVSEHRCDNSSYTHLNFVETLKLANSDKARIMINFLRAPLFNPRPGHKGQRAMALLGGHWSPIGAVRPSDKNDGSVDVLVLDVNASYGPFIVNSKDLFDSCYTKDGPNFRGLVVVHLK